MKSKLYVGKTFKTNNCGDVVVLEYINARNVVVKFLNTSAIVTCHSSALREGAVRDRELPTVYGVGVLGNAKAKCGGVVTREYSIWSGMLERCFSEKLKNKYPTYKDCFCSESFKRLDVFSDWCRSQVGFNNPSFELDKDVLIKHNKIYSEDTCCFIPHEINGIFVKRDCERGDLPIGVSYNKTKLCYASVSVHKCAGKTFNTPEEAFYAYKEAKETHIKEVANKWKDQIDIKVYNALINCEVEIDD